MPGLGVIVHRGRRSGRRHQTPVSVVSSGNGYVIALTYGPETDWVKNVAAAAVIACLAVHRHSRAGAGEGTAFSGT